MNVFCGSGKLVTEPSFKILHNDVYVSSFCLACTSDYLYGKEKSKKKEDVQYNFFQCLAFGDIAKQIVNSFSIEMKVSIQANVENYNWKDSNGTPHFTQILLVHQMECDNVNNSQKAGAKKVGDNLTLVTDSFSVSKQFDEACDAGFLLLDESDYYNLAISNFVF